MSAESITPAADTFSATAEDALSLPSTRERNFYAALTCALLVHASLLITAITLRPRHLGDETGLEKAISVEIVTEADLKSKTTVPVDPPASPPQPPLPTPLKGSMATEEVQPTPPQPQPVAKASPPEEAIDKDALKKSIPDLLSIEGMGEKPKPEKQKDAAKSAKPEENIKPAEEVKQQQKRMAAREPARPLDTTIPPSSLTGRSASFVRPPGITRSGLNDQFARNVIRALQQTMPRLNDTRGRATIRILLDLNGNIADVVLLVPDRNPNIGQSVVFAAKQTSFPIPPGGSTVADRTFTITYIYD